MARTKTLALVLAGGKGSRLDILTENRAKPAMRFAGVYRLIDFVLSNCLHSGLNDVWVIEQYQLHSLNDHLANGRPWDLDRTYRGLQVLPPYSDRDEDPDDEGGFAQGNADAIYRHRHFIRNFAPDIVVVLSADHIYRLDFSEVIDYHRQRQAAVTMVTTHVPIEDAGRYGTVKVDDQGRVTDFAYKPDQPDSNLVTTEVFVYDCNTLLDTLDQLTAERQNQGQSNGANGEAGKTLKDFGHELLPTLVQSGRAFEYRFDHYWRDVGTITSYWQGHMELLGGTDELNLDDPSWPILTYGTQRLPARIYDSAHIDNSLIAPGCTIRGHVSRSVLSPGVVVEEGAVVRDCVVLDNTHIAQGARLIEAIIDEQAYVGENTFIGEESVSSQPNDETITLIGQKARIVAQARIAAGARIRPGEEVRRNT